MSGTETVIPEWADLRCVECQEKVTRVSAVISDPPRIPVYESVWVQDGSVVLGWTALPCLHFMDGKDWELSYRLSEEAGKSTVTFEPRQVAP